MKFFTVASLLVAGTSLNEVMALKLKEKTFLVNGESVTMWIQDGHIQNSDMTQIRDEEEEENDEEFDNEEEQDEENQAEADIEEQGEGAEGGAANRDISAQRKALRDQLQRAHDELGAQQAKNGAIKGEVMGKLHRNKVISARQKVAPPAPAVPPFENHGIKKYKDADYAE